MPPALGHARRCAVALRPGLSRTVIGVIALPAALALIVAQTSLAQSADQELERRRLQLDIARLERESGWQADAQGWLPAAPVLVAALVAVYGVWKYFDERRSDRDVRTDEGVARNLYLLRDRPPGGANLTTGAILALRNLNMLAPATSRAAAEHRKEVTEIVTALVRDDLGAFHTADDARLPRICVDGWAELQPRIENDPEFCFLLLSRYVDALKQLKARAPAYVRSVKRDDRRYVSESPISLDDRQFFMAIVEGFERFASIAPRDDERQGALREFSATAQALGPQLFASETASTAAAASAP